jgi:hypothetical protein
MAQQPNIHPTTTEPHQFCRRCGCEFRRLPPTILMLVLLFLITVTGCGQSEWSWEIEHRDAIETLKQRGDELNYSGKYAAAKAKYDELLALVDGHDIVDELLRQHVDDVRASLREVMVRKVVELDRQPKEAQHRGEEERR